MNLLEVGFAKSFYLLMNKFGVQILVPLSGKALEFINIKAIVFSKRYDTHTLMSRVFVPQAKSKRLLLYLIILMI